MFKTPPVEALMKLKRMQEISKQSINLEFEFTMLGAELHTVYGMEIDEITKWVKEGKSDV